MSNFTLPAIWLRKPRSAISAFAVIPDLPAFKLANTSVALFPIEDTTPNPVTTTLRMVVSFLLAYYDSESATFMSFT